MAKLKLEVGSFGEEVKNLHRKLAKQGFAIPSSEVDRAFFGPGTRDAVLQWQRSHGLPGTGIVDERTNATLEAAPQSGSIQPQTLARSLRPGPQFLIGPRTGFSRVRLARRLLRPATRQAKRRREKVIVNGTIVPVPYPFPSPTDWRDCWMYFLMIDRFANHQAPPKGPWNQRFDWRQGGTFKGILAQLDYLRDLGVKALWLSPVLKNSRPDWQYTYTGYDTQDFLNIDERFGSDGTRARAERELGELISQAHARGIFVIVDMVINHAAKVFDYVYHGKIVDSSSIPK